MVIIPARLDAGRLPRKLLLDGTGKPLLQYAYEAAKLSTQPEAIVVATDSCDIAETVLSFGGSSAITSPHCASGTNRVAEVARTLPEVDVFVNVQGDEPEIPPSAIDLSIELLVRDPSAMMSTLAAPIRSRERLNDSSCVKVVFDQNMRAIYFSRAPIPFARDWDDAYVTAESPRFYQHIGLYAYRREFLLQLVLGQA